MEKIRLGRTGIQVSRAGFGMLPIQRIPYEQSYALLRHAYDSGINFYDTARAYSDSEAKFGHALSDVRTNVVLATKTAAQNADEFWCDLKESLETLKTDYIDIYQFHNPSFVPMPGGADGLYDAALEAQRQGKIRHIGITQHTLKLAQEAVASGLYATMQYPFNHVASEAERALVQSCARADMGFIAMKALSGGLVVDARLPFAFLSQYDGLVPIWGMQRMSELDQILDMAACPPVLDADLAAKIAHDRETLSGAFCRSCGYCMPCPVGIPIRDANRMIQLLTRSPSAQWLTDEWQVQMERVDLCTHCGLCEQKCPYSLKPYETMPDHLKFYREYLKRAQAQ